MNNIYNRNKHFLVWLNKKKNHTVLTIKATSRIYFILIVHSVLINSNLIVDNFDSISPNKSHCHL